MDDTASGAGERRKLGPVLATVLVAGNIIGSGVFLLPAALGAIGNITLVGWALATAGALALAGMFSILARIKPTTEGIVGYVRIGLGHYMGFQAGMAYWISCWVGNVAIALACVGALAILLPAAAQPLPKVAITLAIAWLMVLANIIGSRFLAKWGSLTLVVGLLPVIAVAVMGWFWFDPKVFAASWNVSGHSAVRAVAGSLAPIFWAFLGLESATVAAAVVRRPERNVPIAAVGGVALSALVYILAMAAIGGLLPASALGHSTSPFAAATTRMLGAAAGSLVALCAFLKASGTLGGWVLLAAETGRASADLGDLPRFMGRTRADGVPVGNLVVVGGLMTVVVLLTQAPTLGHQFSNLIDIATVLSLVVYAYCCLTLLRFSAAVRAGPRRSLARACGVMALLFSAYVIASSNFRLLLWTAGVLALTLPVWLARKALRARRQVTAERTL